MRGGFEDEASGGGRLSCSVSATPEPRCGLESGTSATKLLQIEAERSRTDDSGNTLRTPLRDQHRRMRRSWCTRYMMGWDVLYFDGVEGESLRPQRDIGARGGVDVDMYHVRGAGWRAVIIHTATP